jgi:GNAT superfamily N-acetyltransferase
MSLEHETALDGAEVAVRPLPDGSDVRNVVPSELPTVVQALARSFYDDPVFSWITPNAAVRLARLERGFDLYARRIWLAHDEAYTTDRLIGCAFWMPPDTWHLPMTAQLRMLPAMAAMARGDLPRLMRVLNAMEAKHPHERHWYLPLIGIAPEWQGRGFGAALLRPILERCDREELPAYLEASSPRNRALYERHRFKVLEEMRVKDSPPMWRMWRAPHNPS